MFLYLTTTGRRTGLPREIEIWFTERDGRFYIIAEHGDRANWVRNIRAHSHVDVHVDVRMGPDIAHPVRTVAVFGDDVKAAVPLCEPDLNLAGEAGATSRCRQV